jgi:hypothetical protein
MNKTSKVGTTNYILPFIAAGFYVSDAKGSTVLECQSYEAAKEMATILNFRAQVQQATKK